MRLSAPYFFKRIIQAIKLLKIIILFMRERVKDNEREVENFNLLELIQISTMLGNKKILEHIKIPT